MIVNVLKCPDCGASIDIDNEGKVNYCKYCGAKISITNENEHIYKHIDVARMRELDILENRETAEREKERAEQERIRVEAENKRKIKEQQQEKIKKLRVIGVVFVVIGVLTIGALGLGTVLLIIGIVLLNIASQTQKKIKDTENMDAGMIRLPDKKEDAYIQQAILESEGFTNVKMVNLRDIKLGLLKKSGEIESISVNGKEYENKAWYIPNVPIIITFHGFIGK